MQPNTSNGIISFSMAYLENIILLKKYFKISGKIFDFTNLPILKKHQWLGEYSVSQNHKTAPNILGFDDLYSMFSRAYIQKLKRYFQQQQLQFSKEQKNYYQEPPKNIKK